MVVFSADFCFFSAMLKKKKAPPFFDKKKKGAFFDKKSDFRHFRLKIAFFGYFCCGAVFPGLFIAINGGGTRLYMINRASVIHP